MKVFKNILYSLLAIVDGSWASISCANIADEYLSGLPNLVKFFIIE